MPRCTTASSRKAHKGADGKLGKYSVITIEREYASGGSRVGNLAAKLLGIPCYGREILEWAAQRSGKPVAYFERMEETATNSLLYSMVMMGRMNTEPAELAAPDALSVMEEQVIQELAKHKRCVIIGRCGAWALRERKDVLNVFVYADRDTRRARALEEYGVEAPAVDGVLQRFDRRRANYYRYNARRSWDDRFGYHMMLDSGKLGIETCAQMIANAFEA